MRAAGKVWLVGAGPGDPELLTLKAARVIGTADVMLVDDLVSDEVVALAPVGCRVVHVGKRGGCASTPQDFIERLMVAEASAGRCVVRLKGGDPFVFGRGGEECATLRAAGIAHEVVDGITAGIAAATSIGVPLTHRGFCHGAILVTGHPGEGGTIDWTALAATRLPLAIYMGIARAAEIRDGLLRAGMRPDMPAAIVAHATRRAQQSIATTLRELERAAATMPSPAIILVGEVVALARTAEAHGLRATADERA